jgi:hypothetical protein
MVNALATAAPGATAPTNAITYYAVSDETLSLYQIGATTADSVTLGTAVTVKTGDAEYQASAPAFTGTGKRLVVQDYTPAGTVSQPTFSNGAIEGTASYTPAGTISLTNTNKTTTVSAAASGEATYTPAGTNSAPAFTGTAKTVSVSGTATGTVSAPSFTGTGVRLVTGNIAVPNTYTASFTGTAATINVEGTATGTVSKPTFSGTKVQLSGTTTAAGTVTLPTITLGHTSTTATAS